ncbi:ricin-type beta-trefoil lectin domain protein [Verrucosispora sp. NA02020]|uniref:ricin-type beta-trefoil lectin domain protein n=1 Tax=Verrucosispora sp. NA02020 TaxID=2742132 RepID=UPI0015927341|nr:ricin-type beta-trefoil lectin domain protein [Verrucosispora sp. NA02020]QKW14158.1 ricin-type beta-trefoil lectin domain protein [Verrucosispora sp. NA02020]
MPRAPRALRAALAAVLVAGLAPLAAPPAVLAADTAGTPSAATSVTGLAPEMVRAMRRDLGLTDTQVLTRLRVEAGAATVERRLRARLGTAFAGAWIPAGGTRLTVAVTDPSLAAAVRAEGAEVTTAARSESTLDGIKRTLDRHAGKAPPDAVHGWAVDVTTNRIVVTAGRGATAEAAAFVKASGVDAALVRIVESAEAPRINYDIRGGDQYVINGNTLCSVGFAVQGGFVTAGHCGRVGSPTLGYNNVSQGTFAGSTFPGRDYGWVRTNSNWTPQPWVNNYSGGNVSVAGSQDAAIGSSVCRSGRTTGWRCGTLLGRNQTVNYSQGAVHGLTRTNACAQGGDSGGAWLSGNQAQGVTSGGWGDCSTGGETWFQPVNEILGAYGLTLVTSGGGSGNRLISNWNNKCIDVPSSNFSDGVPLQTWNCNGTAAQSWSFVNGTLRTQNNMCMDVAWGSRDNGAAIQIATCSGNAAQQFVLSAAGDLVNPQANKCVDISGWVNADGARLAIWECLGGANQKWRRG